MWRRVAGAAKTSVSLCSSSAGYFSPSSSSRRGRACRPLGMKSYDQTLSFSVPLSPYSVAPQGYSGSPVVAPVPLVPDELDVAVVEQCCLRVVSVDVGVLGSHQDAAGRRDFAWPAEAEEVAHDVVQVDAQVAGLAIAELAAAPPAARMNARVVVAPGRRSDVHVPVERRRWLAGPAGTRRPSRSSCGCRRRRPCRACPLSMYRSRASSRCGVLRRCRPTCTVRLYLRAAATMACPSTTS